MSSNVPVYDFETMQSVDIRTIDREQLVDIRDVSIDPNLPFAEKIEIYINQIKNPYCFKFGDVIVKVNHAKTEKTIEDCIEGFLRSL